MSEQTKKLFVSALVSILVGLITALFTYLGARAQFKKEIVRYTSGIKKATSTDGTLPHGYIHFGKKPRLYRVENTSQTSIFIFIEDNPIGIKTQQDIDQRYHLDLAIGETVDVEGSVIFFMPKPESNLQGSVSYTLLD